MNIKTYQTGFYVSCKQNEIQDLLKRFEKEYVKSYLNGFFVSCKNNKIQDFINRLTANVSSENILPKTKANKPHKINYSNLARKGKSPGDTALSETIFRNGELYFYTNGALFLTNCATLPELESLAPYPLKKSTDVKQITGWTDNFRKNVITALNVAMSEEYIIFPEDKYFWKALKPFTKDDRIEITNNKITAYEPKTDARYRDCKEGSMIMEYNEPMDIKISEPVIFNLAWLREIQPENLYKVKNKEMWVSGNKQIVVMAVEK